MNRKRRLPILLASLSTLLFMAGCITQISSSQTAYLVAPHRQPKDTLVTYMLPDIRPTSTTKQVQTKGGVTITAEIMPFTVDSTPRQVRSIIAADPHMPGYDQYEIANIPYYRPATEHTKHDVEFRLRIRNNEEVPLRLSQIGFALIIDGLQYSFPQEQLEEWNKGIVLTGFEKNDIIIYGPELSGLYNAKVLYLFLNGVPTSYDKAGNITQKSNFEWYFQISSQTIQKNSRITYTYESEPVHKETCTVCNGTGVESQLSVCPVCNGTGRFLGLTCSTCNGTGRVRYKCKACKGEGTNSFPKSHLYATGTEIWTGWKVNVMSYPSHAQVSVYDPSTLQYVPLTHSTPVVVNWYSGKQGSNEEHPISIEYSGHKILVLPYKSTGEPSPYVKVDFRNEQPVVVRGKPVGQ